MLNISVVIPTFRRPALLLRCLRALSRQDIPDTAFEVLIVSDGPDEITKKAIQDFLQEHSHFKFIEMPEKKGPAAARNAGWKMARASLVAFTDDDTIPHRQWLASYLAAWQHERVTAFTGRTIVPLPDPPSDHEKNTAGLAKGEFITANCCCTKEALRVVNGFDESFTMAWREDSDLQFKFIQHAIPVRALPNAIVVHPVQRAPWGISLKEQKKGKFNALLFKKHPRLYRQRIQPAPLWNYYGMAVCVLLFIVAIIFYSRLLVWLSLTSWFFLFSLFFLKRIKDTDKSGWHILEMLVTSALIPFISLYWHLYGAWKYRVFFL